MAPYYEESGIQLYCGDMREVLPAFGVGVFDLAPCDPPYGIGENNTQNLSRRNVTVCTDYGDYDWDKTRKDNSGDFADCELAWGSLDSAVRKFKWRWNGMLQEDMTRKEPRLYPTQKPVALMKWVLANYSKPHFRILDACCGGGSTLVAAKELGMKAVGVDISERACEIAANRLRQEVLNFEAVA